MSAVEARPAVIPAVRRAQVGETGWQLAQHQPGVMTWRLPGGSEYQTTGDPYPI